MNDNLGRYKSAANWQRPDPYKKQMENARKEYESQPKPGQSMLEIRPAAHWITKPSVQKPRAELYGPLWREGEVSVLFGEKGVCKSFLAAQLAEDIATGRPTLLTYPPDMALAPSEDKFPQAYKNNDHARSVLLIDLEHTAEQFTERYTFPSPVPGKPPRRTRFHFRRASFGEFGEIPKCFKNRIADYLQYSISETIGRSGADVVIFDSISYLIRGGMTAASVTRVLKSLKLFAHTNKISILLTAQTPPARSAGRRRRHENIKRSYQSADPSRLYQAELQLASAADSIFTLSPSTYGPDFRYVKLLATRSPVPPQFAPGSGDVLTYQLNSLSTLEPSDSLPFHRHPSLKFLGPSNESDHLRDYSSEECPVRTGNVNDPVKKLSARNALIQGVLDGSYSRYLKS